MSTATIDVTYSQVPVPDGKTFGGVKFSIVNAVDNSVVATQTTPTAADAVVFTVGNGVYKAVVVSVDSTGADLGNSVSTDFTVAVPEFSQPATVTVTVT